MAAAVRHHVGTKEDPDISGLGCPGVTFSQVRDEALVEKGQTGRLKSERTKRTPRVPQRRVSLRKNFFVYSMDTLHYFWTRRPTT